MGELDVCTRFAVPELQGFPLDDALAFTLLGSRFRGGTGNLVFVVAAGIRLAVRLNQFTFVFATSLFVHKGKKGRGSALAHIFALGTLSVLVVVWAISSSQATTRTLSVPSAN